MNLLLSLAFCSMVWPANQGAQEGLTIYSVDQPYPDFTQGSKDCYYCFDLDKTKLSEPLFTEYDIAYFDWQNQRIVLTEEGKEKAEQLDIPLPGMAVAFVLNGEPVYGFWFWNSLSAYTCDRVCAVPTSDFKISFGLPGVNPYGKDPRFNPALKTYVMKNLQK